MKKQQESCGWSNDVHLKMTSFIKPIDEEVGKDNSKHASFEKDGLVKCSSIRDES
jgi:hypothetical protein